MLNTDQSELRINKALSNPDLMPKRVYRFRILGMALGGIAIAAVLFENNNGWPYWLCWVFSTFLWPHVAYLTAKNHQSPFLAERRNLQIDSFIAGAWAALMWFNLLPAVLLLVVSTADKVNSGIRNLWWYSQPVLFLGVLLGGLITGFTFKPETSMQVMLCCLPIVIIHTFFVSMGSYKLVRKVQFQNIRLRELSQLDGLTQMYNRSYWYDRVNRVLKNSDVQSPLTLMLIDIDYFKQINDQYGHSIGDDVLQAIARVVVDNVPENAIAGRLGGDEFAIVLQADAAQAQNYAEQICQQIAKLTFAKAKALQCTVSIGLAENQDTITALRQWFDLADQTMYQAKCKGRNQVQAVEHS